MVYYAPNKSFYHVPLSVSHRVLEIQKLCKDLGKGYEQLPDGYNEEFDVYIIDGEAYAENTVAFRPLVKQFKNGDMESQRPTTMVNFETFPKIYTPFDVTNLKNIRFEIEKPLFDNEKMWDAMVRSAKTQDTTGVVTICSNKKLWIPVIKFYDADTGKSEQLVVIFNAKRCMPTHHGCCWDLSADVGSLSFVTSICYSHGEILDWEKVFRIELEQKRKRNPGYDPFDEYFDDDRGGPLLLL